MQALHDSTIYVIGYADNQVDPRMSNYEYGLGCAKAVAKELSRLSKNGIKLCPQSLGDTKSANTGPVDRAKDRRVELVFKYAR